ncbi:hypothetical protein ATORI0001_1223 [Lancefieldella rimae ATCC 49626]|uniref:Uncharacterized protein n=1 Tax=Lancefieldella rimae (strain ATCC 49626 / DSM 7090 / CCUG 31168 / NBRC 15546 / VPI D140H-11A) TaxID=553184 RepID=B9CLP5_LANR4|nr:hypothetical protein ATORI0001_1223 [Lancefieldella rimae ATCC 49626]
MCTPHPCVFIGCFLCGTASITITRITSSNKNAAVDTTYQLLISSQPYVDFAG